MFKEIDEEITVKTTSSSVSFSETESTPPFKGGEFKRQVNIMITPIIEIKTTNNSFPFLREGGFDFRKEIKDGRVKSSRFLKTL